MPDAFLLDAPSPSGWRGVAVSVTRWHASDVSLTMTDIWYQRDLPVLRAVVNIADIQGGGPVRSDDVAEATGFEAEVVWRALRSLLAEEPKYFEGHGTLVDRTSSVTRITGHAKRAAGVWPTADGLADLVREAIAQAAEKEPDEEKRSKLRSLGIFMAEGGRDLVAGLINTALTGGLG